MNNSLVFLDVESTGLDPDKHEVWEIAWAVNDEPIQVQLLPHSLATADFKALEMNGYWDRADPAIQSRTTIDLDIRKLLEGHTLVVANPTFDRMFLRKRWGLEPYHYRSIDVETVALTVLGYERPKGMSGIVEDLRSLGYSVPLPTHSAESDVAALRESYKALMDIARTMRGLYTAHIQEVLKP